MRLEQLKREMDECRVSALSIRELNPLLVQLNGFGPEEWRRMYKESSENGKRVMAMALAVKISPVQDDRVNQVVMSFARLGDLEENLDGCDFERVNLAAAEKPTEFENVQEFGAYLALAMADSWPCKDGFDAVAAVSSTFFLYLELLFNKAMASGASEQECLEMAVKMHLANEDLNDLPRRVACK